MGSRPAHQKGNDMKKLYIKTYGCQMNVYDPNITYGYVSST